jgi:SAM-dependent methyltransferase
LSERQSSSSVSVTNDTYRGEGGQAYLEHRQSSLSDHVQGIRASLFQDLGGAHRTILDFGCGSGGLLKRLTARKRIGVEVGEAAAMLARESGIDVVADLALVPDASVDVAISFHALEHVERPIDIMLELGRVTKPAGLIRIIVPGELAIHPDERNWRPNPDHHLHTWTPLLLGNLASCCCYREIRARAEAMPTKSRLIALLSVIPPLARAVHWRRAIRRNALNVILDARPPDRSKSDRG